jgi:probable phosphoglycerate mutase
MPSSHHRSVAARILLVRHGQSEWNAVGRWQGQADPPLSDLGREQAYDAAQRLGTVDLIACSDLQRATDTAMVISEMLGVGPVVIDPRLRERDAGAYSGLTRAEIDEQFPGYLEARREPPGWESDDLLLDRVHDCLHDLAREYTGAEIVVITHGGCVYALEKEAGHPFERLANLAGRWLHHHGEPRQVSLGERVLLVDGALHTTVPQQI